MLFEKYSANWAEMRKDLSIKDKVLFGQTITLVILALVLIFKSQTVVLTPPGLSEQAVVGKSNADSNFKKSWGMYFAELMGNLVPDSVDSVKKWLTTYMSPDLYSSLRESIEQQSQSIKDQGITVSFAPKQVVYEQDTNKVFVSGTSVTTGHDGSPLRVERTYEFVIAVNNYSPIITAFNVYRGEPHTQDWIARNPSASQATEKKQ